MAEQKRKPIEKDELIQLIRENISKEELSDEVLDKVAGGLEGRVLACHCPCSPVTMMSQMIGTAR